MIQLETEGKGSTFSKASFVADGSSDISIDDPEFWQKWAEKAKLNLEELANKVGGSLHLPPSLPPSLSPSLLPLSLTPSSLSLYNPYPPPPIRIV